MTSSGERRRPRGRIGGIVGPAAVSPAAALVSRAVGDPARTLLAPAATWASTDARDATAATDATVLVADWDWCQVDGRPIDTVAGWRAVVRAPSLDGADGAFALAWWIPSSSTLRLARDGVGERTMFYAIAGSSLVFGSSLAIVLASGLVPGGDELDVDPAGLAAYLAYSYVPGRRTLLRGVQEVLPGEAVEWRAGHPQHRWHWCLPDEDRPAASEDAYRIELRARLEAAVARRLPGEGAPVVASLSGGVDSSLVVALAQRMHPEPITTYSLSFGPDHPNELPYSALVAGHCGATNEVIELSPAQVLGELDRTMQQLSSPIGDPLTVPNALLFRRAAETAGVVLNGEGGDPSFGGPKNLPMVLAELYVPPDSVDNPRRRSEDYLRAHRRCYGELDQVLEPALYGLLPAHVLEDELTDPLADPRRSSLVGRLMALNVRSKGGHHILPKVDQLSGAAGVVPSSPLFDREVVALAARMPAAFRLHGATEKHILKCAVADLLPASIVERRKSGMRVPVEAWFQTTLLDVARERLLDGPALRGLVRRSYVEQLLDLSSPSLARRRGAKIWMLVSLEAWLRGLRPGAGIGRAGEPPAPPPADGTVGA